MVKTEFGLLEMQRKGLGRDALELGQTELGVSPEGLNSIDMAVTPGKLVFSMMGSEMLRITDIDEALPW